MAWAWVSLSLSEERRAYPACSPGFNVNTNHRPCIFSTSRSQDNLRKLHLLKPVTKWISDSQPDTWILILGLRYAEWLMNTFFVWFGLVRFSLLKWGVSSQERGKFYWNVERNNTAGRKKVRGCLPCCAHAPGTVGRLRPRPAASGSDPHATWGPGVPCLCVVDHVHRLGCWRPGPVAGAC